MEGVRQSPPGVKAAQFSSFARRMPFFYAAIVFKLLAASCIFYPLAPAWLACGIPGVTCVAGIWRALWWAARRAVVVTDTEAEAQLRKATTALIGITFLIVAVDCRLFFYGAEPQRVFLLLQMIASSACGVYCLMHLRRAALFVGSFIMLAFGVLAVSMHSPSITAAAASIMITTAVMIYTMLGYEQDFFSLIRSKAETLRLSQENLHLAHLDMLTGLPNRRFFFEHIEAASPSQPLDQKLATVGLIDLDGFKPVNDTYGHAVGDRVLEVIAQRLQNSTAEIHNLSRLGGDEFAFTTTLTNAAELRALGSHITRAVSERIELQHRIVGVGCSVGFAVRSDQAQASNLDLYERADYALYQAKRMGRARTVIFSEEHENMLRERGLLEQTLRNADLASEFYLVYQPIVEPRTGRPVTFECLARWESPVLGRVSPASFIPAAEGTGMITKLTLHLLDRALCLARSWPEHIRLSYNISSNEIADSQHVSRLIALIFHSGVDPRRIALELTESALINNFSEVKRNMELIRQVGISIYLDDFGTGHSSLSYVHSLPLDKIKVDRSFVQDISSNTASRNIVRSVISLCRDLQLACVIEGVETPDQLVLLNELDADFIQGFYFSKPLPENAVAEYLAGANQKVSALQAVTDLDAAVDEMEEIARLV